MRLGRFQSGAHVRRPADERRRLLGAMIGIFFFVLRSGLACVNGPTSNAQRDETRPSTVLVAPINLVIPLPTELQSAVPVFSKILVDHLESRSRTLITMDARAGQAIWLDATNEVRSSGREETFENAAETFARKLGEKIDFDALVIPSLYLQNARIQQETAYWDGANQKIEFIGRSRGEMDLPRLTTVSAASALVIVVDRNGLIIHKKRSGLELVQHLEIERKPRQGHDKETWVFVPDEPVLQDELRMRAAVAHVLYPFVQK